LLNVIKGNEVSLLASTYNMEECTSSTKRHQFRKVVVFGAAVCGYCGHFILSHLSVISQCSNCNCYSHSHCERLFPEPCGSVIPKQSYLIQPNRRLIFHQLLTYQTHSQQSRGKNNELVWIRSVPKEGLLLIFNDSMLLADCVRTEKYELNFIMKWESRSTLLLARAGHMIVPPNQRVVLVCPPRSRATSYTFFRCDTEKLFERIDDCIHTLSISKHLTDDDIQSNLTHFDQTHLQSYPALSFECWILKEFDNGMRWVWCVLMNDAITFRKNPFESKPFQSLPISSVLSCQEVSQPTTPNISLLDVTSKNLSVPQAPQEKGLKVNFELLFSLKMCLSNNKTHYLFLQCLEDSKYLVHHIMANAKK
jgi:hypothetical protein